MHFCAIHLDEDGPPCDGEEEVYVVVPGTTKTALAVPLDALSQFLVVLEQAVGGDSRPQCPNCGAAIPKLEQALWPGSPVHAAPADTNREL